MFCHTFFSNVSKYEQVVDLVLEGRTGHLTLIQRQNVVKSEYAKVYYFLPYVLHKINFF